MWYPSKKWTLIVCILKIKRDKNHRNFLSFFFFLHYLVNIEVLSQKGALLFSRLSAVIDQDLSESCYSLLWLAKCEGLTPNCKVDVIFCQRPPSLLIHLHGLAVTPKCVPPLHYETAKRMGDRRTT